MKKLFLIILTCLTLTGLGQNTLRRDLWRQDHDTSISRLPYVRIGTLLLPGVLPPGMEADPVWVAAEPGYLQWADTATRIASQFDILRLQSDADTNSWDATRHWVTDKAYLTVESDPVFAGDSAALLHFADTTAAGGVGIATAYDLTQIIGSNWTVSVDSIYPTVATLIYNAGGMTIDGAIKLGDSSAITLDGSYGGDLVFDPDLYNVGLGNDVLTANTSGYKNVAIGEKALTANNSGLYNVAVGNEAAYGNTSADDNVAVGSQALYSNSVQNGNTALGYQAGYSATGKENIFIGYKAGYNETGGDKLYIENSNSASPLIYGDFAADSLVVNGYLRVNNPIFTDYITNQTITSPELWETNTNQTNIILGLGAGVKDSRLGDSIAYSTMVGLLAGYDADTVTYSTFLGYGAGGASTNATNSTFLGESAGVESTNATASTFLGESAGRGSTNAANSTFLGENAGAASTNATNSTFLGENAGYQSTNASYSTFLGYGAGTSSTNASYSTFLGNGAGASSDSATYSTFLGSYAGAESNLLTEMILIGDSVAYQQSGLSHELWIDDSPTATPLIRGFFASDSLVINGDLTATGNIQITGDGSPKFQFQVIADTLCSVRVGIDTVRLHPPR